MLQNIHNLMQTLESWAETTFEKEYFRKVPSLEKDVSNLVHTILLRQNLLEKPMDGFCSERLAQTEVEQLGIKYALIPEILDNEKGDWTPLDIIIYVCENNLNNKEYYETRATKHKMSFEDLTAKMCARALRALPSTIREYQLLAGVKAYFPDATIKKDIDLDLQYHCDAKMTWKGKTYWFWSFIASKKSIDKFAKKFTGVKGSTIAAGYHVLCGFNRFDNEKHIPNKYHGWDLYPESYLHEIQEHIFSSTYNTYETFTKSITSNEALYQGPTIVQNRFTKFFGSSKEYRPSAS